MLKIQCPSCGTDSSMSLLKSSYEMPFRCWKCHEYFTLKVEDDVVQSLTKLTADEYQKIKATEDLRKFNSRFGSAST
jgi:uncharacterized Zn finger protein